MNCYFHWLLLKLGTNYKHSNDEQLGFEASVATIAMKANVCEADHPLLCEGTRRQVSSI